VTKDRLTLVFAATLSIVACGQQGRGSAPSRQDAAVPGRQRPADAATAAVPEEASGPGTAARARIMTMPGRCRPIAGTRASRRPPTRPPACPRCRRSGPVPALRDRDSLGRASCRPRATSAIAWATCAGLAHEWGRPRGGRCGGPGTSCRPGLRHHLGHLQVSEHPVVAGAPPPPCFDCPLPYGYGFTRFAQTPCSRSSRTSTRRVSSMS
jgi:hypothetical protein